MRLRDVAATGETLRRDFSFSLLAPRALPALLAAVVIASGCSPAPPDERDYATRIASARAAKDAQFAGGDDPIPQAKHAQFLPLAYFPIDPDYNVPGTIKAICLLYTSPSPRDS